MRYVAVWAALLVLLAATAGSSYIPMGGWNAFANMAISSLKALLVALFFMQLRHEGALVRLAAVVALVWLALLFGLSWTDYSTRGASHAPWSARP
ncbi:MAG: Caa(3)-type oxidase subunit IV [Betaproteobacteria bacterium]|nr:MAG: Caa(3)-type oxidase subunit IV [Betaproteobacteria bacterium]